MYLGGHRLHSDRLLRNKSYSKRRMRSTKGNTGTCLVTTGMTHTLCDLYLFLPTQNHQVSLKIVAANSFSMETLVITR